MGDVADTSAVKWAVGRSPPPRSFNHLVPPLLIPPILPPPSSSPPSRPSPPHASHLIRPLICPHQHTHEFLCTRTGDGSGPAVGSFLTTIGVVSVSCPAPHSISAGPAAPPARVGTSAARVGSSPARVGTSAARVGSSPARVGPSAAARSMTESNGAAAGRGAGAYLTHHPLSALLHHFFRYMLLPTVCNPAGRAPTVTALHHEACYQQSDTMFPAPPLPPAFADAAYNLLLASICRRWRRLAQRHVSTLLVKKDRAVSRDDLAAAVACFPHLTHLHLSDGSAQPIDDAFLAHLPACCPKLTAFHLGSYIVPQGSEYDSPGEYDPAGKALVTPAGFDAFFRGCTQLEHLSLGCLHANFGLPPSLFQLAHLRSLAVADLSSILTTDVEKFTSLTALAINTEVWDFHDLENLALLPRLASLSITEEISSSQATSRSPPFSFPRLPSLTSLDLGFSPCPPFDRMFPAESPCSMIERLSLYQCGELHTLPDDMGERLPRLRELSITMCNALLEQPDQVTSLTSLRSLNLAECAFRGLPDRFGHLPCLTSLVLHKLNIHFPASFSLLHSLETLVITDCATLAELPAGLGALTALKRLCVAECPSVVLPGDVGQLTSLHTLFLKSCTAPRLLPPSFTQLASLARLELGPCIGTPDSSI
ncbi:unnamed protein product [Closterium sp. Naga37s-1]|nr:unnamed protein product [Closterium sp. Naga37s-1]